MRRPRFLMITFVVLLLLGGWFLFRTINSPSQVRSVDIGFRAWFWEMRALDLAVQVILVFAGALGIAAILPGDEDDA